jgi:hypothetical protein
MGDVSGKKAHWNAACEKLKVSNSSWSNDNASMFISIVAIDTLLEINEEPDVIADDVHEEFKALLGENISSESLSKVQLSVRTDGEELGVVISLNPSDYNEEEFCRLADSITEAVEDYLS